MKFSNSFGFVYVYKCGLEDQKKRVVKECFLLQKGPLPDRLARLTVLSLGLLQKQRRVVLCFNETSQGEECTQ